MTAQATILRGRRLAERLMVDTCMVANVGAPVTDPATGAVTVPETVAYTGSCKVQSASSAASNPVAGGATFTVQRSEVHVPVGSLTPAVGQVVTLTAVALDPLLIGRRFRVVALLHKSMATAYRLGVEEIL